MPPVGHSAIAHMDLATWNFAAQEGGDKKLIYKSTDETHMIDQNTNTYEYNSLSIMCGSI